MPTHIGALTARLTLIGYVHHVPEWQRPALQLGSAVVLATDDPTHAVIRVELAGGSVLALVPVDDDLPEGEL
jgi:hypothetical protein